MEGRRSERGGLGERRELEKWGWGKEGDGIEREMWERGGWSMREMILNEM